MKEYVYVFDYSQIKILRITLDDEDYDNEEYLDITNILKRRGLKESQCAYLFTEKVVEVENVNVV